MSLQNRMWMVYPYYENPKMLEKQVENWNRYAGELRDKVKVILIDDGSPKHPAYEIFKECKIPKSLYRIKQNIPWNQHGARNLGAKVACKDEDWIYMSDMDIILTPEMAYNLLSKKLDPHNYYTFERAFAPHFRDEDRKYHCNTFLVRRSAYWAVGGYDEDYCGTYGGDGPFLRQLNVVTPRYHLNDVVLLGFTEDVVEDANTREWGRKETQWQKEYRKKFDAKRKSGDERAKNPLRFEWEKLI